MAMEQTRETTTQSHTLVALVAQMDQVVQVVRRLHEAGFTTDQISLLAKDHVAVRRAAADVGALDGSEIALPDDIADAVEPKGRPEMGGMAMGGAVGFLVGLTAVAIPGFGAFLLAAGPVAIALNALTVGAAGMGMGALLGAIFDEKVTEEHKARYHDHLEKGGWMMLVHADDTQLARAEQILHEAAISDVETI
ncbi:hypothetical protein D3C72_853580 [compost metagenome]